jgi:hypothetical protein
MNNKRSFVLVVLFITAFLSLRCEEEEVQNPNEIVFPEQGVSYGKHVEPLFFRSCIFSGCHNAEAKEEGKLSLETFNDAISFPGVIIPRDTINSRLIQRVKGLGALGRMPPPTSRVAPLNDNQIHGLAVWIMEGAQNN